MNTDTGKVYVGPAIQKAQERGENVVPVSPKVATLMREARQRKAALLREIRAGKSRTTCPRCGTVTTTAFPYCTRHCAFAAAREHAREVENEAQSAPPTEGAR